MGTSLDRGLVSVPLVLRPVAAAGKGYLSCADCTSDVVDVWHVDDGSGRQRWIMYEVPQAPGEYNIMVYAGRACDAGCWYLSAHEDGRTVNMWPVDDGSGRQRWVFRQMGDSRYQIRLAGGKADDKVFLGIGDDGKQVRLFSKDNSRSLWDMDVVPYCDNDESSTDSTTAPPPPTETTHVPRAAVQDLKAEFTERQLDTILQLISLPENGTPKWYKQYGYIEFLGDGRGFTATIFGACSGTGDLYMIVDELSRLPGLSPACKKLVGYKDALKRKQGDDIKGIEGMKGIIKELGDDPAWQEAVWKVYIKLYWKFALDFAAKRGAAAKRPGPKLTSVVAKGFMVDTAINHGADMSSFAPILKRMAGDAKDEQGWLRAFADAREKMLKSGYDDLDTSRTGDRCRLWKALLVNPELKTPFTAYEGYWGKYTIS